MSEPKRTRLYFFGFAEEMVARTVLEVIKDGRSKKAITVEDWVLVHKAPGGKLTITNDKSKDPGAAAAPCSAAVPGWSSPPCRARSASAPWRAGRRSAP